jgi:hypothetical protein
MSNIMIQVCLVACDGMVTKSAIFASRKPSGPEIICPAQVFFTYKFS